jgi:ribosomal protein L11 methyltransferase
MGAMTIVARLACAETPARHLANALAESLDADNSVCSAFEDTGGQWQVTVHFRIAPDEAAVRALVKLAAGDEAAGALAFETLTEADWVMQSLAGLSIVPAGHFVVHGAHDRARVPVHAIAIEIEAALAFGTGHHGTTRGCLLALDSLAKRRRFSRVLDVGTGSGVLAIAAAKRLRCPVIATDIDPRAVDAARANARLNHAGAFVTVLRANGVRTRGVTRHAPYDLVLANILLGPLTRLAMPIRHLCSRNARVVLSGLLPAHANAVLALYRAQGLTLEQCMTLEGWVTLVLRRGVPMCRRQAASS